MTAGPTTPSPRELVSTDTTELATLSQGIGDTDRLTRGLVSGVRKAVSMSEAPAFFPDRYAAEQPEKPAYVMARSGETVTYRQLVERSCRAAHAMRALGTEPGACVA